MKLLPGPFGWDSVGTLAHVQLAYMRGRPAFPQAVVKEALWHHSCHPPAVPRILSCLRHSVYQCLMRPGIAREVTRCGCLARAGVQFTVLRYLENPL